MHPCLLQRIMFQVLGLEKMQQPCRETSSLTLKTLVQLSQEESLLHMREVQSSSVCFKWFQLL